MEYKVNTKVLAASMLIKLGAYGHKLRKGEETSRSVAIRRLREMQMLGLMEEIENENAGRTISNGDSNSSRVPFGLQRGGGSGLVRKDSQGR